MMKRFLSVLMAALVATCATSLLAKVEQKPVYICGYAVNFADSAAYLTAVQCIDTAYVESKNGFLMDRNQYSSQLNHYMTKQYGGKNYTCSVIFDQKKSRLEKRLAKMRKRGAKDESVRLKTLTAAEFLFIGEQYVDPTVVQLDEDEAEAASARQPASDTKATGKDAKHGKKKAADAKGKKGGRG